MKRILCTALCAAVAAVAAAACVDIESDDDDERSEAPPPGEDGLDIDSIDPDSDEIAPSSPIVFYLSDYLEEDSFASFEFAWLSSGGLTVAGEASYRMVDRAVVWQPYGELDEGLTYEVGVDGQLESATGAPFAPPDTWPRYTAVEDAARADAPDLPDARWEDVEPIVDDACAECHADPDWGLNPLTYDSLVGRPSEQTERTLVRPGDPADSYLMHKLLWDYPQIRFTHQPPPWHEGAEPLSDQKLRVIEGWIRSGARR